MSLENYFISKQEYFSYIEKEEFSKFQSNLNDLKNIQDLWVFDKVRTSEACRIAEIGGGVSRILRVLDPSNELFNVDEFLGNDGGPKDVDQIDNVKIIKSRLGLFDSDLPTNYFDIVFSVSVMEHVPSSDLPEFYQDMYRILKPGGIAYHAIDAYLISRDCDNSFSESVAKHLNYGDRRFLEYFNEALKCGFSLMGGASLDEVVAEKPRFQSWMASNSDLRMHFWNKISPSLVDLRNFSQSVSIKIILRKLL